MSHHELPRPTDSELSILRVLWQLGPSTVRRVQEELLRSQPTGYTTVLKLMQIMTEKGLVTRDESERAHIYHPRYSEQNTQRQLVADLLDRAFDGNASQLVMQALSSKPTSPQEVTAIRRLLDSLEGGTR